MPNKIILDKKIVDDTWQLVHCSEDLASAGNDVLVTLAFWHSHRTPLLQRPGRLGVWLKPDDDVANIVDDLNHFSVVAIDFPVFSDGRGYSSAYLLRQRYGYRGELRAVGDVLRDQMFYLHRVGFNAFAGRADRDLEVALQGLNDFSEVYQASITPNVPHFQPAPK